MAKVKKKYDYAVISTDVAIFTIIDNELNVLLMKMNKSPYIGYWAIPGGLVKSDESVDDSAKRHLYLKAGVKGVYLEQLYTFGKVNRDPFGRVVSVAYFALIPNKGLKLKSGEGFITDWFPVKKLPKLAYDHKEVIETATDRLKSKLEYTNIIYSLLPEEFTLGELQNMYEIILGRKLDKRNFRKKILSVKLIKKISKKKIGEAHRPAELYKFIDKKAKIVQIL